MIVILPKSDHRNTTHTVYRNARDEPLAVVVVKKGAHLPEILRAIADHIEEEAKSSHRNPHTGEYNGKGGK